MAIRRVNAQRGPAIHRKDYDGTKGEGGLVLWNLPLWLPFAPRWVMQGKWRGCTVIRNRREKDEFIAAWNDYEPLVKQYGALRWDASEDFSE